MQCFANISIVGPIGTEEICISLQMEKEEQNQMFLGDWNSLYVQF